jgi:hypothetical protein
VRLATPNLELAPGKILCLHIPDGFHDELERVEKALLQLAARKNRTIGLCRLATPGFTRTLGLEEKTIQWLSKESGISDEQAKQMLTELGVPVAEKLVYNPGTARVLLGIASMLARKSDVIVYCTDGLDFSGRWSVHRFLARKCAGYCLIHIASPTELGNGSPAPKSCPAGAECIELNATERD